MCSQKNYMLKLEENIGIEICFCFFHEVIELKISTDMAFKIISNTFFMYFFILKLARGNVRLFKNTKSPFAYKKII